MCYLNFASETILLEELQTLINCFPETIWLMTDSTGVPRKLITYGLNKNRKEVSLTLPGNDLVNDLGIRWERAQNNNNNIDPINHVFPLMTLSRAQNNNKKEVTKFLFFHSHWQNP